MLEKRKSKMLFFLEIMEFILSIIAIIVLTMVFRFEKSFIRYLFLIGDIYVIYSFSKTISNMETKIESRVVKNSESKINSSYEKKLSA